jgi:polyisoprenoid-binding protein YceI
MCSVKSILIVLLLSAATLAASSMWRPEQADVRIICPMTIGGSFDARTTLLSGALTANGSSAFDGSLAVDLRTLDTGVSLRNEHLRGTYLEVDKGPGFDRAVVSDIVLKGLNPEAPQGKGTFAGSLTLHGATKPVTGPVDVRPAGSGLRVKASFPLNLSDYSIAEPRYLGVGVRNTVQVEVAFAVTR